ncbi:MAG: cytidine deaminase [Elusimicrobia bacterium]|nr:cytidine deaminase [Elusimicrobiota bacterium]
MHRPDWDEYFLKIAELVSSRSTCIRRHVGAVIVKEKRILATGYNGAPSGISHCADVGCIRETMKVPSGERHELCRGLHAEQNAIIQAAYHGVSIKGSVFYITSHPCSVCAKMIINAGIGEIIIKDGYPDKIAEDLLSEAGIKIRRAIQKKQ